MKIKNLKGFRLIFMSLCLVLLLALVVSTAACSGSNSNSNSTQSTSTSNSSNPATTTSSSASGTTSTSGDTFLLRMAPGGDNPPPAGGYTKAVTDFVDLIQTRTNGRVKIQVYWSQTLVPQNNIVSAIQSGTADIGQLVPHVETGKIPLAMVGQQPGIGTDLWARISAYYDLCNQDPEKAELAKFNIKTIFAAGANETYLISKNPIRTLADLKGKKVAATGIQAQVMNSLGAVPVTMGPTDQYTSIDKGTIDAIGAPLSAVADFKFYEVTKYYTYLPCGTRAIPVGINMDVWNKFPADIQKVFTDAVPELSIAATDAMSKYTDPVAIKAMQEKNIEFINLNETDMAAVNQVLASLADQWAAGIGDDGKKILSDYRALVEKYEKISPYKK